MFKIGRKATELERQKLQMEIHKEESKLRRKQLEKCIQMASNKSRKGDPVKNLKKEVEEEEDDDFLDDLVVDTNPGKPKKSTTDSNLKPGGFIMKAEDRKGRLDQRHARIAVTSKQDEDAEEEETEKEQLERETRLLESQLRKAEKAAEKVRDQE